MMHFKPLSLAALTLLSGLCTLQTVQAATPQEAHQIYQSNTAFVSTSAPGSQAASTTKKVPSLVVEERGQGTASSAAAVETKKVPTLVVEERGESTTPNNSASVDAKDTATQASSSSQTQQTEAHATAIADEKQPEAEVSPDGKASTATQAQPPVVSNKPVAKPKPKPKRKLVQTPPQSRQYMRVPVSGDFVSAASPAGYTIDLPTAFGEDQLAGYVQGPMLLRAKNDNLYATVSVQDPTATQAYLKAEPLPDYANKKILWQWVMDAPAPASAQVGSNPAKTDAVWNCTLSTYSDYVGNKVILQAETEIAGKRYEQLYVMPADNMYTLLPQAMQALMSLKLQ